MGSEYFCLCVCVCAPICLYVLHVCRFLRRPEEDVGVPGNGVTRGCKLSCGCCGLNLGPLPKKPVLLRPSYRSSSPNICNNMQHIKDYYYCGCGSGCVCVADMCARARMGVEARGQLCGAGSLHALSHGLWGRNSATASLTSALPTEPSHQPGALTSWCWDLEAGL